MSTKSKHHVHVRNQDFGFALLLLVPRIFRIEVYDLSSLEFSSQYRIARFDTLSDCRNSLPGLTHRIEEHVNLCLLYCNFSCSGIRQVTTHDSLHITSRYTIFMIFSCLHTEYTHKLYHGTVPTPDSSVRMVRIIPGL